ncbi:TPA: type 1 fimbrial protein [Escherichia coli]|nr:type 1 fimbrial protein [Escherichia coli]
MKPGFASYIRALLTIIFLSWGVIPAVFASCNISGNGGNPATVQFSAPALVVNSDAVPGTIIATVNANSPSISVSCTANGEIWQGYTVLTNGDKRTDNPLTDVFQTNVPGIGFRAAWANNTSAQLTAGSLMTPWHKGSSTVIKGYVYPITIHAAIQFIVTGPVGNETIDTSKLIADWKYDNRVIGELRFSSVPVNIQPGTCDLIEKNITVPLNDIGTDDFDVNNVSPVVSDDRFKIQIEKCSQDVKVDYRFTSSGSTGITGNSILNIESGSGMAEGVGLQILDSSNNVMVFDSDYTAIQKTTLNQNITIPLKARYIKTGSVKSGRVNSVATFEVYYR